MTDRTPRILIAGLGNIFLGDDAFGVEVARRLLARPARSGVRVVDFGIAGIDLIYALQERLDLVILVDAVARGGPPGTLYLIQPDMQTADDDPPAFDPHDMDPAKVLAWAASMPQTVARVMLLACEISPPDERGITQGLSQPVQEALEPATSLIERLVAQPFEAVTAPAVTASRSMSVPQDSEEVLS